MKQIGWPGALLRGARVFLRHPSREDEAESLEKTLSSRRFHYPW
jgi:hypothetical protein